jgi:hypothetical protein
MSPGPTSSQEGTAFKRSFSRIDEDSRDLYRGLVQKLPDEHI